MVKTRVWARSTASEVVITESLMLETVKNKRRAGDYTSMEALSIFDSHV